VNSLGQRINPVEMKQQYAGLAIRVAERRGSDDAATFYRAWIAGTQGRKTR
jgi:hypothetical protein